MADNMNIFGKMATSLGNGVKKLFGPLMNAFGQPESGSGEKPRLAKYLEAFNSTDDGQENSGAAQAGKNGDPLSTLQKLKRNDGAFLSGMGAAPGREPASGGSLAGLSPLAEILQAKQGMAVSSSMPGASPAGSPLQVLADTLGRAYGESSLPGNAPQPEGLFQAAKMKGIGPGAFLESFDALGKDATGSYGNRKGRSLAGLNPLAAYFEGTAGVPAMGESGGYLTAPSIIPPAPEGDGSSGPVESRMEIKGAKTNFKTDPADNTRRRCSMRTSCCGCCAAPGGGCDGALMTDLLVRS